MLQRVMIDGIELPRLYIAENYKDAELAKSKGIPYIRWTQGQEELIKMLLRPVLERMFPHIKWNVVLGRKRKFKTKVQTYEEVSTKPEQLEADVDLSSGGTEDIEWEMSEAGEESDGFIDRDVYEEDGITMEDSLACGSERLFDGGTTMLVEHKLDIEDYVGDMSSYVNIEMLQRLRLMPAFIGDILDCVKLNMTSGIHWSEGYNKRLGLPVGRFNASPQLPNLIILDVSGSIPRGISATMISLIDTLRTQLSADLIITGSNSRFYPMGEKLPDPQKIRDMFGYGNEQYDFFKIMAHNLRGRHYGHVFSFGDNDTPRYCFYDGTMIAPALPGTTVEFVHHYHTGTFYAHSDNKDTDGTTGYAKWCHMLDKEPQVERDTSWCKVISD